MSTSLETLLYQACLEEKLDLHDRLERVKRSAREIWSSQRLPWFTDHTVKHSERIVEVLSQIVADLQKTDEKLNPHEMFILLSACYLHDIGMQDFVLDGRGAESFTIADYELIRKQHPKRGKELIINRSLQRSRDQFRIDIDDDPSYLVPIALVSQGHGSDFFELSVEQLRQEDWRPRGKRIRGDLLTALLMVGDELDLNRDRASIPREMNLSPISSLHHYVHSYVNYVEVSAGETKTQRRFHLSFHFPSSSECDYNLVCEWIGNKLVKQLNRTSSIIENATGGLLRWALPISVSVRTVAPPAVRELTSEALSVLHQDLLKVTTVNYQEARRIINDQFISDKSKGILSLRADDEQALVQLVTWTEKQLQTTRKRLLILDFKHKPYGRIDVFRELRTALGVALPENSGPTLRKQLEEFVSVMLLERPSPTVVLLQNLDAAETTTAQWIMKELLPKFAETETPVSFLATFKQVTALAIGFNKWPSILLGSIEHDDIAHYLMSVYGYNTKIAHEKASEIYGVSGGRAQGVIFALAYLRQSDLRYVQ